MSRTNCHRRRDLVSGFTLIEILLVLSLVSSLLAGTIGLMTIVGDSMKHANENRLTRSEIRRFADDVRRDVIGASEVAVERETMTVLTGVPPTTITYQIEPGQIQRHKQTDSDTSSGEVARDRYLIGPKIQVQASFQDDDSIVQWTLTQTERPAEPLKILAARRESR